MRESAWVKAREVQVRILPTGVPPSTSPLAHPTLPKWQQNRIRDLLSQLAWIRGQSRSSTATERPDTSGKCGFDAHRARQFRRAVECGLSVKSERTSGFKSRPSRQMAGFPSRLLWNYAFRWDSSLLPGHLLVHCGRFIGNYGQHGRDLLEIFWRNAGEHILV